jgi:hypothetical protein
MTVLALRRRTHVERKVLALLRGEDVPPLPVKARRPGRDGAISVSPSVHTRYFAELRRLAAEHGLAVQSPATPFVSADELRLLAGLAEAQRIVGSGAGFDDPALAMSVTRCAGLLDGMGLRLSPLTLYGAKLRATGKRARL